MSPRKLTEDDKQEILQLYRNSEATTSTLANRYEVSSSTISRFLKNKLSSIEYEDLIQQKRLARTPRGEKKSEKKEAKPKKATSKASKAPKAKKTRKKSLSKTKLDSTKAAQTSIEVSNVEPAVATEEVVLEPAVAETQDAIAIQSESTPKRRRRRRSSASDRAESSTPAVAIKAEVSEKAIEEEKTEKPAKLIIDKKVKEVAVEDELDKPSKANNLILKNDKSIDIASSSIEEDEEDDDNEVDLITLKEMLGEDLEDINDEEDEEDDDDDDDWEEDNEATVTYPKRDSSFSDLEILPLARATFPRTCYLVIDRSAELIVKPLAEFADLGEIPQDEIRQRTLPVFDNHRIAKRFSHRRERVIKVPDGRMLQKTSHYLQEKGITRLLMDGQIYSLST